MGRRRLRGVTRDGCRGGGGPGGTGGSTTVTGVLRRLVVGVDGSGPSARALAWAGAVASMVGGEVVAVHVLGLLPHRLPADAAGTAPEGLAVPAPGGPGAAPGVLPARPGDMPWPSEAQRRADAGEALHDWCERLRRTGVAHRAVVVDGSPAPALLAVAAATGADAVVVGPRGGRSGLGLGSTSHDLVTGSPIPVVVVPDR